MVQTKTVRSHDGTSICIRNKMILYCILEWKKGGKKEVCFSRAGVFVTRMQKPPPLCLLIVPDRTSNEPALVNQSYQAV
jgi:hypothetical protein